MFTINNTNPQQSSCKFGRPSLVSELQGRKCTHSVLLFNNLKNLYSHEKKKTYWTWNVGFINTIFARNIFRCEKYTMRSEHKWSRSTTRSLGFEWKIEKKLSVASVALQTDTFCKLPAELWMSITITLTKCYTGKYVKDTLSRSFISGLTPLVIIIIIIII
jgi:hypothetical protein